VLADPYAPLIFVNGADAKSAQMFTLAHELAHVWVGKDGLFNLVNTLPANDDTENFCNQVAARRALDLHRINRARFFAYYRRDQEEWQERKAKEKLAKKGGPNFYTVQDIRLGRRFAQAVFAAVHEGSLLYRDAYRLTDLKGDTFDHYAKLLLQRMKDERR